LTDLGLLGEFFGCIVYADDLLLLSNSVEALRHMLTICENFAVDFDVKFNIATNPFLCELVNGIIVYVNP